MRGTVVSSAAHLHEHTIEIAEIAKKNESDCIEHEQTLVAAGTSSITAKKHAVSLVSAEDAEIAPAIVSTARGKSDVDEEAEAPRSAVEQKHQKWSTKRRSSLLVCIQAPRRARSKRIRRVSGTIKVSEKHLFRACAVHNLGHIKALALIFGTLVAWKPSQCGRLSQNHGM